MGIGQVLYFGLLVRIGTETYAAHTMAGNIEAFTYIPVYGLAVAATRSLDNVMEPKNLKRRVLMGTLYPLFVGLE